MCRKIALVIIAFLGCNIFINAQTLFTYGKKSVDKAEFLKAFNKNPSTEKNKQKAINEYLELYINFKLKVQAAIDDSLQKDENFIYESQNFKQQIITNAINEEANITALTKEAFLRSKKDIQLAQILIETPNNTDTSAAFAKASEALAALKKGADFTNLSAKYNTDKYLKENKGIMGWVTTFSLPYELETIVYGLPIGGNTPLYHSQQGYHIFKVIATRSALGKRTVNQLLVPIVAGFSQAEKDAAKAKIDAIYAGLQNGKDFTAFSEQFGLVPAEINVSVGTYELSFEEKVFSLAKKGSYTAPFLSSYGWHILKLKSEEPVATTEQDATYMQALKQRIEADNRLEDAKNMLVKTWMINTKYQPLNNYNKKALWDYVDSSWQNKPVQSISSINTNTVLFTVGDKKVLVNDFAKFVKAVKLSGNQLSTQSYSTMLDEYAKLVVAEYYKDNLPKYKQSVADQINEFDNANLLFAMMDKKIWSSSTANEKALENFYNANKAKYTWQPSVSALVVSAISKEKIDAIAIAIKQKPTEWRSITNPYANDVVADSSRFEYGYLPTKQKINYTVGATTIPEKNANDDGYSFIYIMEHYPTNMQRNFADAKGMVIADYQLLLEKQWLQQLKTKYPVVVNPTVKASLYR